MRKFHDLLEAQIERDAWTKARVRRLRLERKTEPIPLPEGEEGSET